MDIAERPGAQCQRDPAVLSAPPKAPQSLSDRKALGWWWGPCLFGTVTRTIHPQYWTLNEGVSTGRDL